MKFSCTGFTVNIDWERHFELTMGERPGWSSGKRVISWFLNHLDMMDRHDGHGDYPFILICSGKDITLTVKPREGRVRTFRNHEYAMLNTFGL